MNNKYSILSTTTIAKSALSIDASKYKLSDSGVCNIKVNDVL